MITVNDLVEFRLSFRGRWEKGYVEEIAPHIYKIRTLAGVLRTVKLGGEGRGGKVRALTGARCVGTVSGARAAALPSITHCLPRRVQAGPAELQAVPRPRSRYRSPVYLAFVRARPCCSCGTAGPSDPHHDGERGVGQKADDYACVPLCRRCHKTVTDTNALPGLDRAETQLLVLRTQVALLSDWAADGEALFAEHVAVPVLARCAS